MRSMQRSIYGSTTTYSTRSRLVAAKNVGRNHGPTMPSYTVTKPPAEYRPAAAAARLGHDLVLLVRPG